MVLLKKIYLATILWRDNNFRCQKFIKFINALCGQHKKGLNVKIGGMYNYHCAAAGQAVIDSALIERFKWPGRPSSTHLP